MVEERAYARFPRLKERRTQTAGTLSGGEQQMLAMARGLATDPALLILDELSMGLAPIIVEELYAIVAQVAQRGRLDPRGRAVCQHRARRGRLRSHYRARPDRTSRSTERVARRFVQGLSGRMTGAA